MKIDDLADRLGKRFPLVYRLVRPPWRAAKRLLNRKSYWEERRAFNYYREVIRLAEVHVPGGGSVIDVGANETSVLFDLSSFTRKVALDVRFIPPRRGLETVVMDFMRYAPPSRFDLVLCLQVLEHLDEPGPFARKLFETGRTVIISVPYEWPAGAVKGHVQDPVDEAKLLAWTGREPDETCVVADRWKRLIAVYCDTQP